MGGIASIYTDCSRVDATITNNLIKFQSPIYLYPVGNMSTPTVLFYGTGMPAVSRPRSSVQVLHYRTVLAVVSKTAGVPRCRSKDFKRADPYQMVH